MNEYGILTTDEERDEASLYEYGYPKKEGSFTGTLVHRSWHPRVQCLQCYFETDEGDKYVLNAWYRPNSKSSYAPRKSKLSFATVEDGTKWKCIYSKTSRGFIDWEDAESVD